MIAVAATIVASVAAGALLERRSGELAQRAARALLTALVYAVLPLVTFFNIARLHITGDVGGGIVLAYVALLATGAVAWLAGRRVFGLDAPATGSLVNASMLANTGYLGLPLSVALLGSESLGQAVAYDSLVSGPMLLVAGFGVGAMLGERAGSSAGARLRAFLSRNPPLLAAAAALMAPEAWAPDVAVQASRTLVLAMLPLGFLALGAILSAETGSGAGRRLALTAPVSAALALRLALAPALLAALAAPLIELPKPYLLLAAMPCGINALAVAHLYGLDVGMGAAAIAWSTVAVVLAALLAVAVL